GDQASAVELSEPDLSEPARGAALVPAAGIVIHVSDLAFGAPAEGGPWLPWPVEALLVWLPWVSACLWALRDRSRDRATLRLCGLGSLALGVHYVAVFRWGTSVLGWSGSRLQSELAAFLSSSWGGAPWIAFAYALGWT